jgi:peptide/nickel transport system permease protein
VWGACVFGLLALACILAPLIRPGPNTINFAAQLKGPSFTHPFGTDELGRDVLARVLAGGRVDLLIGVVGTLLAYVVGTVIGVGLGYYRGRAGEVAMRGLDAIQAFPLLIFALALLAFIGQSVTTILYAVAFVNIPIFIRLVRVETLSVRDLPYIEAARCVGNPPLRIIRRHILPNVLTSSLTQLTTSIGYAILLTGALSFLGVGIRPPSPEWGSMIQEGSQVLLTGSWWISIFPGVVLFIAVISLQIMGGAVVRSRRIR